MECPPGLGHEDPYCEILERFSVAPSAAFNSFHGVSIALINNYRNELIKWPSGQTTEKFEDMKHIPIKTCIENPNDYINQKFSTLFSLKTKSVDFN